MHPWLEEFYPIPAADLKKASDEECLNHSIRKWSGLLKKNLKKHKVKFSNYAVEGDSFKLHIAGNTCALCKKHFKVDNIKSGKILLCETCPLYTVLGHSCDTCGEGEKYALFHRAILLKRPILMINALKKCLNHKEKNHE